MARREENCSWLQLESGLVDLDYMIYTHHDGPSPTSAVSSSNLLGIKKVPNMGREATSYLKYILDHYENLRPVTAFIHAHRKAWHQKDMGQTLKYIHVAPRWGYMSLNDATKGGGGFKKGWKISNITEQTQRLDPEDSEGNAARRDQDPEDSEATFY
eukprot:gene446-823_t